MRPRVLVLTSTYPSHADAPGPRFVADLAERMQDDFDVTVLAPHAPGLATAERTGGVDIRRFRYLPERWELLAYGGGITDNLRRRPLRYLMVPFFLLAQMRAVWRILKREPVHLVHAHWWIPQGLVAVLATRLARKPGVPVLCTLHGADVFVLGRGLMAALMRWVLGRCKVVCAVSTTLQEGAEAVLQGRQHVALAPMGVDLRGVFGAAEDGERSSSNVLFAGRFVEKKGLPWLLRAFAEARARFGDLHLHLAGDGPMRSVLEAEVAGLGVSDGVTFHGMQPHRALAALASRCGIAVVPSVTAAGGDREGLGLTAIEAMGCGCALVVSDAESFRDIVEDGESALVVRQQDVSALSSAILKLATDNALRDRIAAAGRASVIARFDWGSVSRRYRQLYRQAMTTEPDPLS